MTINLSSRRTFRAEIETQDGPQQIVVVYRAATAAEKNAFRAAYATKAAFEVATNPTDRAAVASMMSSDVPRLIFAQSVACVLDLTDSHGAPIFFDGKPWGALNLGEREDVAAALEGLFNLVFTASNPQAEARLLGK